MDSEDCERLKSDVEEITIIDKSSSDEYADNMKDDLPNSKRKLENEDKKDQKPTKRAKLVYHVDKLIKCEDKAGGQAANNPLDSKNVIAGDGNSVNNIPPRTDDHVNPTTDQSMSEDEYCEKDVLKTKCLSEHLTEPDEDVIILENDVGSNGKDNATPNKENRNYSMSGKKTFKRLTPKQLVRRAEIAKKKEEREILQQEKQRMKKERQEEKFRMKKEKEEEKRKLREEKEKKRQAEIELRNEEKRKKEEERQRKEEQKLDDKRKKEEQQRKKEEEEELLKKKHIKEAEAFTNFFKKCDVKPPCPREDENKCHKIVFMPFTVKADMRLAPINRNPMNEERRIKFEDLYQSQSSPDTYLVQLRSGLITPRKDGNTWPLEEKYPEIMILEGLDLNEDSAAVAPKRFKDRRPKLLQFSENKRPPYWGTWRKKSKAIRARNPLGKDEIFDYEVDSDDEWEEEEPGESLHGSDDEKESEDEYEVDNDFFVPHGYLSDDENPEGETLTPETQKAKLKLLGEQFDLERSEKTKLLKPLTLGCIWFDSDSDNPSSVKASVVEFLNKRKAVLWTDTVPIPVVHDEGADSNEASLSDGGTPTSSKKAVFPDSAVPDLIGLIHGSTNSRKNLAKTFLAQWTRKDESEEGEAGPGMLSQALITRKIKELGKWEEVTEAGPNFGKWCWHVRREVREKFGVTDPPPAPLPAPTPDKGDEGEGREAEGSKNVSLITKFTKILTEDERRSQLTQKTGIRKSTEFPATTKGGSTPGNDAKVTTKTLKCVTKLRDFWAKPSLSQKYSLGVSVSSTDEMTERASTDRQAKREPSVEVILLDSDSQDKDAEGSSSEDMEMTSESAIEEVQASGLETKPEREEDRESASRSQRDQESSTKAREEEGKTGSKTTVKKRAILVSVATANEATPQEEPPSSSPLDRFIRKYEKSKKSD